MIDFTLTDEQRMLRDLAHDFAVKEILPVVEHFDKSGEYPWPIIHKAQEIGLMNLNVPEAYGGPGVGVLEECIVAEELAWACSGIQTATMLNQLACLPIIIGGSEEQKMQYLGGWVMDKQKMPAYCVTEPGAGSDVAGIKTVAARRGDTYVLNGTKTWITNGPVADLFVVLAKVDPTGGHRGLNFFIVERGWGVKTSKPIEKMGQHASWTSEVIMEDVEVPAANRIGPEGAGFKVAMEVFNKSRPPVAAGAVGVARRAMEEAIKYAKERKAFGHPIASYQGISFMVADMAMNIHAGRLLTWQAAWLADQHQPNAKESAFAKAFCADMAMKTTTDAVQVFGGYGYSAEYPVEKLMRDAKIYQIYEGTSQIQRTIIARELFK